MKEKFLFHKKNFNVTNVIFLDEFEKLMDEQKHFFLECSCKLNNGEFFTSRFNLIYPPQGKWENINSILNFLNRLSKNESIYFDYSFLDKIFNKEFNLNKLHKLILGVDLRENPLDSRIKIYFFICNYPEKAKEIMLLTNNNKETASLVNINRFGFGIILSFNGKTIIRTYPLIKKEELKNKKKQKEIKNIFSKNAFSLFSQSDSAFISINEKTFEKKIYFKTKKRNKLISNLNHPKLNQIHSLLKPKFNLGYIAIQEKELDKKRISNFTIYY